MKNWMMLWAVSLTLVGLTSVANAADPPRQSAPVSVKANGTAKASSPTKASPDQVSQDLLQQMGLGGMRAVSDSEGLRVRGKGLTITKQNLAAVTGVRFGGVYIFQKINVYTKSGSWSSNNVILP